LNQSHGKLFWGLILLEAVIFVAILWDTAGYSPDDAYIYQYGARQLARGELPNMTPGETPTNSWGSHLWLSAIAPAYLIGINGLVWAKLLGLLCLGGVFLQVGKLLGLLRPEFDRRLRWALAGTVFTFAGLVYGAVNGLETGFHVFTLLTAVRLFVRDHRAGRPTVAQGLAWGLHLLSRPDAFIDIALAGCVLLWLSLDKRYPEKLRYLFRPLLGLLPGLLLFGAVAVIYGTILPSSAIAKIHIGQIIGNLGGSIYMAAQDLTFTPAVPLLFLGLVATVFSRKKPKSRIHDLPLAILALAVLLVHLGISILIGDWMMVHRLWLGGAVLALCASLVWLVDRLSQAYALLIASSLGVLALGAGLLGWRQHIIFNFFHAGGPAQRMGEYIHEHALPDSWMITTNMGVLPFYADLPAIDAEKNPICNHYLQLHPADLDYIFGHPLDFVILTSSYLTPPIQSYSSLYLLDVLYQDPRFREHYRYILTAEWRPAVALDYWLGRNGRYFHLFVSDRIMDAVLPDKHILLRSVSPVDPEESGVMPGLGSWTE